MDSQSLIQDISNVGFPIVVSIILLKSLLNGFHKRLDRLDQTMNELIGVIKDFKRSNSQ